MSAPLLPTLALDHVGIAAAGPATRLTALLADAPAPARRMPSGVVVGRFGPGRSLELVWPGAPGSPVAGFLDRRGGGLHHVAFQVPGPLPALAARLAAAGVPLAGGVEASSDGRLSLFVHPRATDGVLVELVEGAP